MKHLLYLTVLVMLFSSSCMNNSGSMKNDQIEKNKAGMLGFYDKVFNAHNVAMIDSFCTPDYVEHSPDPGYAADREGLKKDLGDFFAAFPDINAKVNFVIADSNMVVTQITVTGTNTGPMMGMPATGKKIQVDGVDIVRIKNGMAAEHWGYTEQMKMMQELGLMPPPGSMPGDTTKNKM